MEASPGAGAHVVSSDAWRQGSGVLSALCGGQSCTTSAFLPFAALVSALVSAFVYRPYTFVSRCDPRSGAAVSPRVRCESFCAPKSASIYRAHVNKNQNWRKNNRPAIRHSERARTHGIFHK